MSYLLQWNITVSIILSMTYFPIINNQVHSRLSAMSGWNPKIHNLVIHLSQPLCRKINGSNNKKNTVTPKFYVCSEDVYGSCLIVLVTFEVVTLKGRQRGIFFKEPPLGLLGGKCHKIRWCCPVALGLRLVKGKQRGKDYLLPFSQYPVWAWNLYLREEVGDIKTQSRRSVTLSEDCGVLSVFQLSNLHAWASLVA